MILVHVIPPEGWTGHRHEVRFPDGTKDQQILDELTKPHPGREGDTLPPVQQGFGRLREESKAKGPGIAYLDHAQTVVAIGRNEKGEFVEERRLRGPAPVPAEKPAKTKSGG